MSPTGSAQTWLGTGTGPASLDESTCTPTNCDSYQLTLTGTPADWVGKKAHIVISWPNTSGQTDYDVFVHKGSTTSGALVGSSATSGPGPEIVDLDPNQPGIGTGVFTVNVVYFLAAPPDQYTGTATAVSGAPVPTPTPSPGSTPTPTPIPPGTARFHNFVAPPGFGENAGEPSVGVNWLSENVVRAGSGHTFSNSLNAVLPNGGTETYYGGFLTEMLRITFDDCSSPANAFWEKKPVTLAATPRALGDPILFTDHGYPGQVGPGRTFVSQEEAQAGSTTDVTDNDGDTFMVSQGAGAPAGVDHQTVGAGPYHAPTPPTAMYPATGPKRAVYYASQSVTDARTSRSDDGGITFLPAVPMYTTADCGGLHGHIKVAPDGTVYVPNNACGGTDPIGHVDGQQAAIVSEDNGITWSIRAIPNSDTNIDRDPSIGIATDGTVYMGMQSADGHARISVTHDKGLHWSTPLDVGVASAAVTGPPVGGINNMVFPEVVAGDPNRAAFAFYGRTTAGNNYSQPDFPGVWYLYISTTYDGGAHWTTVNATPGDPIQRGGICGGGTCRNLLDFFDITIDKEGRVVVGWDDGCVGGCVNGGNNSFTAKATLTRQSGGKRMLAAFDPVEPTLPGAPAVTGTLTGSTVRLAWSIPDDGASPITGYHIFKGTGTTFTLLATTNVPNYTDATFVAGQKYRVTAINGIAEGPYCKEFVPVAGAVVNGCTLPGVQVINDLLPSGADNDSAQNTPADPRVNIKQLFMAEPFINAGTEQLIFTLLVAPSTAGAAPANSQWIIVWNRQGTQASDPNDAKYDRLYVAMVTDAAGTPTFEYGKFGIPINTSPPPLPDPSANSPAKFGVPDMGTYDPSTGIIRIKVANSKFRTIDGGPTKYVAGTDLAAINVRTYFNRPDYMSDPSALGRSQRSQNNASDITDNSTYSLAGNNACAPQAQVATAVSRKVHAAQGAFDVRLIPVDAGNGIEPRRGNGAFQIVVGFVSPVTFTGATVGGGGTATTTPGPNSPPTSEVTINLTGVADVQRVNGTLTGTSAGGAPINVVVPLAVLLGDVTADGVVNSGDTQRARTHSGELTDDNNFRDDVNLDGTVNSGDSTIIRARSGNGLPPAPPPAPEKID
ncbi:MAG: hypothetical protein M3Z22_02780 [Verrucomicrobiota bacterium]|nr:hypothetical protein [Verrucomicrobiota bacterium]